MPKENINDIVTDGFRAEVGWSNGCVQVATTNANSTFELPVDDDMLTVPATSAAKVGVTTNLTASTSSVTTAPAVKVVPPPEPFYGWHVTLDRDGCNRMIKALRKARDSAFGRDE